MNQREVLRAAAARHGHGAAVPRRRLPAGRVPGDGLRRRLRAMTTTPVGSPPPRSTSATPASSEAPAPARPDVRVFNISEVAGAAEGVATRLRDAEVERRPRPATWCSTNVTGTTVYYGEAPDEREAADEVGKLLEAPVEPRMPELAEQPPGVIVVGHRLGSSPMRSAELPTRTIVRPCLPLCGRLRRSVPGSPCACSPERAASPPRPAPRRRSGPARRRRRPRRAKSEPRARAGEAAAAAETLDRRPADRRRHHGGHRRLRVHAAATPRSPCRPPRPAS